MTTFRVFGTFRASHASHTAPRPASSRPPGWLPLLLATPVHCLILALGAVGVWLLWPGTSWMLKAVGVLALALDWLVLPRRRDLAIPGAAGVRGGYVAGAVRSLRRWEELLSPYRPHVTIASEHQVLLHASGGDHVLGASGGGGLLADVASLILAPPRLLAAGYRGLLERTARHGA